jgi:hypothetical protein
MKIVCSWCRREGKAEFVGEKAPLDDARETHGICLFHRDEVHGRWQASLQVMTSDRRGLKSDHVSAIFRWGELLNITRRIRP